jgi:hypothetical protein
MDFDLLETPWMWPWLDNRSRLGQGCLFWQLLLEVADDESLLGDGLFAERKFRYFVLIEYDTLLLIYTTFT